MLILPLGFLKKRKQKLVIKNKDRFGHSTLAMTERYAHLAPNNSLRTVATLENFLGQSKDWEVFDLNR